MLILGECGGIVIDNYCVMFDLNIYVVGECVLWDNKIFGLVVFGYIMVCMVVSYIIGGDVEFVGVDMSIKFKLMGVEVGLIGDVYECIVGVFSYIYLN